MEIINLKIDRKVKIDGSVELRLYDVMLSSTDGNPNPTNLPIPTSGQVWNLIYKDAKQSAWIRY